MNQTREIERPWGGPSGRERYLAFALLALAFLMWVLAPGALLMPLPTGQKGWAIAALLGVGEVAFWVSAFLLGREVVRLYRAHLDPRRNFRRKGP